MKYLKYLILFFITNTVFAADWHLLNTSNSSEELYVDRDSIESLKNSAVKVAFKFNTVGNTERFIRVTTIMRCKEKTSTIQEIRLYSYKTDQIFKYDEDQQTTDPIKFETRNGDVFNYVCNK